jgi:hypothetical protein
MTTHIIMALTNPIEGREDDYDRWFEQTHVPELLAVPQIASAQRYEIAADQLSPVAPPYRYLTAYEVDGDDLPTALANFARAAQEGTKTDASDVARRAIWTYTAKGAKRS